MMISEDQLRALDALYAEATPGRRKVVNLNADDPPEYGPLWSVTNDALNAEQDWEAEVRFGEKADAEFDAAIYNAWPDLLTHIRHLHAMQTFIRTLTAAVEDRVITPDMFYQRVANATPTEIHALYQIIQHAEGKPTP